MSASAALPLSRRAERVRDDSFPRWAPILSTIICVAGIAVASYLTYAHFTTAKNLACSDKGFVNCAKVTTSSYSHPFGIPVAVAGLVWFVGMFVLCLPPAWRMANEWVHRLRLLGAVAGIGTVFWLVYVELIKLDSICIYCTAVHALTFLLFVVIVFATALRTPAPAEG
jgi:uncharacterized membrane protein